MSLSGQAGLFTMDGGRFFGDLRGTPYTANRRQGSGALRLEFGQLTLGTPDVTTGLTSNTVRTNIYNGIVAVASWTSVPTVTIQASGSWDLAVNTPYSSGYLRINSIATGQYSGQNTAATVNYMVVGF